MPYTSQRSYLITYDLKTPPGKHSETRNELLDNHDFLEEMPDDSKKWKKLPNTTLFLHNTTLSPAQIIAKVKDAAKKAQAQPSIIAVTEVIPGSSHIDVPAGELPPAITPSRLGLGDRRTGLGRYI